MSLNEWINYRKNTINKDTESLSEELDVPHFIFKMFEDGTLKIATAQKITEKLLELYSVDKSWFILYFPPAPSLPVTGEPFRFNYLKNLQKAPFLGSRFGQHIEPHGEYVSYAEPGSLVLENYETGTLSFNNPLVIPWENSQFPMDGENQKWGWKSFLVETFQCEGAELSAKLISQGFDGIITIGTFGENTIGEIVNLSGTKQFNP